MSDPSPYHDENGAPQLVESAVAYLDILGTEEATKSLKDAQLREWIDRQSFLHFLATDERRGSRVCNADSKAIAY